MIREGDIGRLSELFQENGDKGGLFVHKLSGSGSLNCLLIARTKDCNYLVNVYQGRKLLSKGQIIDDLGLYQVRDVIKEWKDKGL